MWGRYSKFSPGTVSKTVLNVSFGHAPRSSKARETQAGMHFDVGATRRDRTGDLLITKQTRWVFWTFFTAQVIDFSRSAFFGDRPIWTQTTADHCKFSSSKSKA